MGLFGQSKPKDPRETVREMKKKLRSESRSMDRSINNIKREEMKVKKSLQEAAKKGDKDVCKILAKEIVNSRRSVSKLHASKAQINSICMQMDTQVSMIKMAGGLKSSAEVMKMMNRLTKVDEISHSMMELQKEMTKAGIIEEMMEETMAMSEDEEMEEDAEKEVEKILFEVTKGQLGTGEALTTPIVGTEEEAGPAEASSDEEDALKSRLAALRS